MCGCEVWISLRYATAGGSGLVGNGEEEGKDNLIAFVKHWQKAKELTGLGLAEEPPPHTHLPR